jgi:NodT family efflux transporter outer membrane factor (OMF) lipoprotein
MAFKLFPVALFGALVLTGCVAPGRDAAVRIRPASSYAAASLATPVAANWPVAEWWRAYADPQLDGLIAAALQGSPDVAAAGARVNKAEALVRTARAAQALALSANASGGLTKQSYNNGFPAQFVPHGYNDYGRASLDFSYEIDFWGKNRAGTAAARRDAAAADADRAAAVLILSTSVASTYAQLAQLCADRNEALASVQLRADTLKLVTDRVAGGLDTRAESQAAAANVPAARGDLAAIDESIALTRNALAALTGAGPDAGLAIAPPATNVSLRAFGLPETLSADLIGHKPEIVAARLRAEAAAARIHQARAQFYPNINLVAFIGLQSLGLGNLVKAGSDIGQVGPAFSLPLFDGGRLKANLRGAEAEYALAVAQYDGAVVRALQEVADAAASARALNGRLAQARLALTLEEDAYRVARLRYTGGLANYQSVLLVENDVLLRRRSFTDLSARAFVLDVALIKALGGGYQAAGPALAAN